MCRGDHTGDCKPHGPRLVLYYADKERTMALDLNRRNFLGAGAAAGLNFIPSHALRGQGGVAPSDKITVAYVGCGTEGHLELMAMLTIPEVQVVAVCDPVKFGTNYNDFTSDRVTAGIRRFLGKPDWRAGLLHEPCASCWSVRARERWVSSTPRIC